MNSILVFSNTLYVNCFIYYKSTDIIDIDVVDQKKKIKSNEEKHSTTNKNRNTKMDMFISVQHF